MSLPEKPRAVRGRSAPPRIDSSIWVRALSNSLSGTIVDIQISKPISKHRKPLEQVAVEQSGDPTSSSGKVKISEEIFSEAVRVESPSLLQSQKPTPIMAPVAPFELKQLANALPIFMPTKDPTLPPNLLPNGEPRMNAKTGVYHPRKYVANKDSRYANGLLYVHSHEKIPEDFFTAGLTEDLWMCSHNMELSKVIPGIPDPYFDDCGRGHALYITGLDSKIATGEIKYLFQGCGTVRSSICVIDMISGMTFRWIVMGSFQEAQSVIKQRHGKELFGRMINICYALPPGLAIPLRGGTITQFLYQQRRELIDDNDCFKGAMLECYRNQPGPFCDWFNELTPASITPYGTEGHTAKSPFVGYIPGDLRLEKRKDRIFNPPIYSELFNSWMEAEKARNEHQARARLQAENAGRSVVVEEPTSSDTPQIPGSPSDSDASTIVPARPRRNTSIAIATPLIAVTPKITSSVTITVAASTPTTPAPSPSVAPIASVASVDTTIHPTPLASVPAAVVSSWANIAAPAANTASNLVFDLHPDNKPSSTAPRLSAPVNPNVIAHQQGESPEEQMRTVFLINIPSAITLQDVSDAISEGPVLTIRFATDSDNGRRYVGIVFQYAEHAKSFIEVLVKERRTSQPGRFRFIAEVGTGPTYPYDELLEEMEPPTCASRRLTIVKKGFFFVLTRKDLRKICTTIAGPGKIQLIWFYNGGNASVVFADVKSAIAVKTKFDQMAEKGAKFGSNMANFEGLGTNYSKDPCLTPMNLYTDIPDHNHD